MPSTFRLGNELVRYLWTVDDGSRPFILGRAGISYTDKNYLINLESRAGEYSYQYVISGEGYFRIDGKEYALKKGDVFLLPKGKPHQYNSNPDNPMIKIFFCFSGTLPPKILSEYRVDNVYKVEGLDLYEQFREIFNLSFRKQLGITGICDEAALIFMKIVQKISRQAHVFESGKGEAYRLKEYIETNLMNNISLQDMADYICLSRSQTIRIFKEHFGVSPYEYFMENKMNYAMNMLKNSEKTIKQIAYECGFEDENYFSRVFKQKFKLSPRTYRKKWGGLRA